MMRWLKDKKREKRSNSSSQNDAETEDDYGFGKEKSAAKSPSSRRQLPPTPATPEEKSPHIYEEIPDLPLSCLLETEKIVLQKKSGKSKLGSSTGAVSESGSVNLKTGATQKDDMNPYMVVSVDKEIRQTPTEFHRNGTPEVHCDVIVKDTHCEILLSRKPKVSTFRPDNAGLSLGTENLGDKRTVRNNTHLSSHDRRVSSDVYSGGNQSSAFSVTSSAFSLSSASKIQSSAATSSVTLMNIFDQHLLETCEESNSGNVSDNGVVTYSSASNFIPRSTKLVFNPLPGKNPRKEAFGSDSSDELHAVGYSSTKEDKIGTNSVSFMSSRETHAGSQCVTYASIQSNNDLELSKDSHVLYAPVQDQSFIDEKIKSNYSFDDLLKKRQPICLSNVTTDSNNFCSFNKTGVIQSLSPSTSSNCIYALVTFPAEPKHYDTISGVISSGCQENLHHGDKTNIVYSSMNEQFGCENDDLSGSAEIIDTAAAEEANFSRISSFQPNSAQSQDNQAARFDFSKRACGDFSFNQFHGKPGNSNYLPNESQIQKADGAEGHNKCSHQHREFPEALVHAEHRLELEFCLCSDEHSSSCGCSGTKHGQEDDISSIGGITNEDSNSCRSCGRLIRQITYSESYSDETYEHVYASRLLIRTGRRFSSPDITFSEVSNSEFQDIHNPSNLDFPYAISRDDSWTSARGSDIIPPSYSAAADVNKLNTDNTQQVKKVIPEQVLVHHSVKRGHIGQVSCTGDTQESNAAKSSSVGSKVISLGFPFEQWNDSSVTVVKRSECLVDNVCDTPNTAHGGRSGSLAEPAIDSSEKRDTSAIPEPKGTNSFSGLLSMLSRVKQSKSKKPGSLEISRDFTAQVDRSQNNQVARCDKLLEEIPDKNTRNLSKLFQRLSNKDIQKGVADCMTLPETNPQWCSLTLKETGASVGKSVSFKTSHLENNTTRTNSQTCWNDDHDDDQCSLPYKGENSRAECQNCNSSVDECKKMSDLHTQPVKKSQAAVPEPPSVLVETASALDGEACQMPAVKPPCKTDSGDTCYEYDVSTSSEGEQTGYEHFLSKVRKTLNLEHEVQHIAESGTARRKRLCKRCKKDGLYATVGGDNEEDTEGLCPHFIAKFGDLRAFFDDMVVDQRAAILDCLTDFMHSPYNIRGHSPDGLCRDCGCEILTSDSESQATMCSLVSQQLFPVTSPNGQNFSCDSDDGTMADNSCESADDDSEENKEGSKKASHYDDNSSGYDEPEDTEGHLAQKPRRKEKKEKKSLASADIEVSSRESENHGATLALASFKKSLEHAPPSFTMSDLASIEPSANKLPDRNETKSSPIFPVSASKGHAKRSAPVLLTSHLPRQSVGLNVSHKTELKEHNMDPSRAYDISRSRASLVTDKVLQDIYAPLPPRALSLLASKNYGPPAESPCTCGRETTQASLATVAAHLAAGETETPAMGYITRGGFSKPPTANLAHCGSDKKNGVAPVQKHLPGRKKSTGGELYNFREKKGAVDLETDRVTMNTHPDNEVFANNGCSSTRKNAESNDCLAPQIKPGNRMSKKERPLVPGTDESTARNRLPGTEPGHKSDCVVVKSLQEGIQKCLSMLPHTTRTNSADLALTADVSRISGSVSQQQFGNAYSTSQELASAELAADKMKYTRRHRLELVALDLLQESAVDEDPKLIKQEQARSLQPKRSKVIEKIAKIFENSSDGACLENQRPGKNHHHTVKAIAAEKNNVAKANTKDSYVQSSRQIPQMDIRDKLISASVEMEAAKCIPSRHFARNVPDTDLYCLKKGDNLYSKSERPHLNFNESSSVCHIKDRPTLRTGRSSSGSRRDKDNENKSISVKSDNEGGKLKTNDSRPGRAKTIKGKVPGTYITDARLAKQSSPTPSTSSASSSSSSKRKSGHAKHKVSRKTYNRKRSKHRSERSKSGHGKEERTYYYFSSDFSDIDVVEVENGKSGKTFACANTKHGKSSNSSSKKSSLSDKKPSTTETPAAASTSLPSRLKEVTECGGCEQEVYSLPSDSADLRNRKCCMEPVVSPLQSPEIRHVKRTDVYKSKKSNNKLLSDVIIRNYDMQLYDNV